MITFCPLASGSSGNCAYLSDGTHGVLIDAGASGVTIERALRDALGGDVSPREAVHAVVVTHEHSDHVSGIGVISRRFDAPIYATAGTWAGIDKMRSVGFIKEEHRRVIEPGEVFEVGGITITPFNIPHDANEPVGYRFNAGGYTAASATDVGVPTDEVRAGLADADLILLESNHDVEMLRTGRYPWYLKKRILGDYGHLSNVAAGQLLLEMFTSRLRHVFLAHLSEENNRPLLAFDTVCRVLNANGVKTNDEGGVRVSVAERFCASTRVVLE